MNRTLRLLLICLMGSCLYTACVDSPEKQVQKELLLDNADRFQAATATGNLLATAIQQVNQVDFVLVPSAALKPESFGLIETKASTTENQRRVLALVEDNRDQFVIGNMKWRDIQAFILSRTVQTGRHDLHVAGLSYEIQIKGGLAQHYFIKADKTAEPDQYYTVAVCQKDFRDEFPGYWYRNGMSYSFQSSNKMISAKESLQEYLASSPDLRRFAVKRSTVRIQSLEPVGFRAINQIQGVAHMSPLLGHQVDTRGYVTAAARTESGQFEIYLQSFVSDQDNDPRTSEGLFVNLGNDPPFKPKVGDMVEVSGTVYEMYSSTKTQMTRTALDLVTALNKLNLAPAEAPSPVILGGPTSEVTVPHRQISTYRGDLNKKPELTLEDGIDFWESLEGMMITVVKPQVVGLDGGKKDIGVEKSYINLFLTAEGTRSEDQITPKGGQILNNVEKDFNPEIIRVIDHPFAPNVTPDLVYEVGDQFSKDLTGVMAYDINLFGDGEYVLYVSTPLESLSEIKSLEDRPKTDLIGEGSKLTIATFNVENLAGGDDDRIEEIAKGIMINLKCPDIVNLVEIQDHNGASFDGDASAQLTLDKLTRELTNCPQNANYRSINIDPFPNAEGGEPGGNIRVAMIYNAERVSFSPRGNPGPESAAQLGVDGSLTINPSRIAPMDKRFEGTRRSLVAEFEFHGEQIFVIGNHLNSKGGDTSLWSAIQPPILKSEVKRSELADAINDFCELMLLQNPNAQILVMGDMNDFHQSAPLKTLAGKELLDLADTTANFGRDIFKANDFYSYNYAGNSQPLDFILGTPNLARLPHSLEVIHINTDYMAQIADHDPVILQIDFGDRE